ANQTPRDASRKPRAKKPRAESRKSAAGHGADDQIRLRAGSDRVRQRRIGRIVGEILLAGEKADKRPALQRHVIADRSAQHRIGRLERVEHRSLRRLPGQLDLHFVAHAGQRSQVRRKNDSNTGHGSVCTSTETTGGKSRAAGAQLSPASADTYTCPPVVPKYTPHGSSASTAIPSRRTLT